MQLVSQNSKGVEDSETEPILHHSNVLQSSKEHSSSCEIGSISSDSDLGDNVRQNSDMDENSNLVNLEHPQCRICLDNGGEDLIAPCHCRGSQKYVHRSCLDNWRSTKEGFAFAHCTECKVEFILRANLPADRWWLRMKFQFLVVVDHAFIFILVQLIVAIIGLLVYKIYGDVLKEMFGYKRHPYAFHMMTVLGIVFVGMLYGFFIAIICGKRIHERHYHVLARQKLTKEYVVEDRDGENKNIGELDTMHVEELKMLGLY